MAQSNPLGFRISRTFSSGGYSHLEIEIKPLDSYDRDTILEFKWQGDTRADGIPGRWYAFHVTSDHRTVEGFAAAAALARRLFPADDGYEVTPEAILEVLAKKRIPRVEYDPRVSKFVPVSSMMPATMRRWIDDYRILGTGSCSFACTAETEAEAKANICAQFAARQDGGESVVAFVQAGQPVFTTSYDAPPEVEPLEALLLPPGTPAAELLAA